MKNLFIILSLLLTFNSCVFQEEKFVLLDYKDFKTRVNDNNIQFFDVRTPEEYNLGHIKGAVNIDFNNEEVFYKSFNNINKSKPVYLYCRSGNRSKKSADKLIELGFSKVYDLKGGYIEWNLNELKDN